MRGATEPSYTRSHVDLLRAAAECGGQHLDLERGAASDYVERFLVRTGERRDSAVHARAMTPFDSQNAGMSVPLNLTGRAGNNVATAARQTALAVVRNPAAIADVNTR